MPDSIIKEALEQFRESEEATSEWRAMAKEDLRFSHGDQWPDSIKQWRQDEKLPCLTIDRTEGPVSQVVGDQRQNDIAIKVVSKNATMMQAVDGKEIAEGEVVSGLIRDIQRASTFDAVQSYAFDLAVRAGLGGWYVQPEYSDERSFDQELRIKRILSPFSVYPDVTGWWDNGMEYCHIMDDIPAAKFRRLYPKASPDHFVGDEYGWTGDNVRTSIWWRKEYENDILQRLQMPDGTTRDMLKGDIEQFNLDVTGAEVLRERKVKVPTVVRRLITAHEVLEETEWVGTIIPVVLVMGVESWVDGRLDWKGMIRKAKDAQILYNLNRSTAAELLGATPKAPYMLTPAQVAGHEDAWKTSNRGNKPYLLYNPDPQAPVPQRQQIQFPAAFAEEARIAAEDIKVTTKIFDAGLGARSNETSGRAIAMRQREGDVGNYVYTDNLRFAVELTGKILLEAIPSIYDGTRQVNIRGVDGKGQQIKLNNPMPGGQHANVLSGNYQMEIVAGPSYTTARQEAVEAMTEVARAWPEFMAIGGDVWIRNMDWPGHDVLADRIAKRIPPELKGEGEGGGQMDAAKMQQAIQQAQMMIQELQGRLEQAVQMGQQDAQLANEMQIKLDRATLALDKASAENDLLKRQGELDRQEFGIQLAAIRNQFPVQGE